MAAVHGVGWTDGRTGAEPRAGAGGRGGVPPARSAAAAAVAVAAAAAAAAKKKTTKIHTKTNTVKRTQENSKEFKNIQRDAGVKFSEIF